MLEGGFAGSMMGFSWKQKLSNQKAMDFADNAGVPSFTGAVG
jgi:hypothetical protein